MADHNLSTGLEASHGSQSVGQSNSGTSSTQSAPRPHRRSNPYGTIQRRDRNGDALSAAIDCVPTSEWTSLYHIVLLAILDRVPPSVFKQIVEERTERILSQFLLCPHCSRRGVPKDGNECKFCFASPDDDPRAVKLRRFDHVAWREAWNFKHLVARWPKSFGAGSVPQIVRVEG